MDKVRNLQNPRDYAPKQYVREVENCKPEKWRKFKRTQAITGEN